MASGITSRLGDEGEAIEERLKQVGQGRLTNPTESKAGDGDAQLGGGDVGIKVIKTVEHRVGAAFPFGGEMLHLGAPNRDQGELGGNKEAVQQDQEDDREQ